MPDSEIGLGDLNLEPFLSPRKPGKVEWGVSVVLGIPTATGENLGTGKWTAGGQKMSLQLEAYADPIRPDDGPESMVLLTLSFLFSRQGESPEGG